MTLTTYAILRLDAKALAARSFGAVVLDEAQAIKNPDSQTARAAYALRAGFRLVLTGTPVENRLEELWSLMHFANRGLLGGRSDFGDQFARPIAEGRAGAAAALRQRIRPFVLRRLKKDVAPELPPRTEGVLRVELTDGERAVYDAVRAATQKDVLAMFQAGDGKGGGVIKALEALLRLRQAACHPALVPGQTAPTSSKIEALLEALETAVAEGHKALVFSQWTSLLDLIEPALARAELPFTRLDGTTRDRGDVVARFQADDGPPVMLVSLKAGGSGLNLTAADHVFLCDPWWNPAVEAQAADRTHRIGQTRPVFVYRLVAAATVEERILALQDAKRALDGRRARRRVQRRRPHARRFARAARLTPHPYPLPASRGEGERLGGRAAQASHACSRDVSSCPPDSFLLFVVLSAAPCSLSPRASLPLSSLPAPRRCCSSVRFAPACRLSASRRGFRLSASGLAASSSAVTEMKRSVA